MSNLLHAKATAGIYAEVINQIYDSIDKRIREAVSNAYDAKATQLKISVYLGREKRIVITDNGCGMDEVDIRGKYINMGGGGNYNNEETIGRIGIGALSIFALGNRITVNTRRSGSDKITIVQLNLENIKKDEKHSIPLEEIPLGEIKGQRSATEDDAEHFTEIVIDDLTQAAIEVFGNNERTRDLICKLERILPVKYRNDDALFDKLPSLVKNRISRDRYVIDVVFHSPNLGYDNYRIYRKSILSVQEARIMRFYPIHPYPIEESKNGRLNICGYLYINAGKQLPRAWQGINARVKNVTIEGNTFFGYEEDAAARVRIGGELFINNIDENHAIQSNRSGFAVEDSDYMLIQNYMRDRIGEVVSIVRQNTNIDSTVKRVLQHVDKLRDVFEGNAAVEDEKTDAENFKELDDESVSVEGLEPYKLDDKLRYELEKYNVDFDFTWSGTLEDLLYRIEDEEDDYYTIFVNERLKEFLFDVAGNAVEYYVGYCGEDRPLIIKKTGKLIINLDNVLIPNRDITKVDIGFIKVVIILYLNYLRCGNNAEALYAKSIEDLASAR